MTWDDAEAAVKGVMSFQANGQFESKEVKDERRHL